MRKRTTGFSLIEMLVAVVILGVLSGIAVPSYRDYVRRSQVSEAAKNLRDMSVGILYELNVNGTPPAEIHGVPLAGGTGLSNTSDGPVEGYRFDGGGNQYWLVARISDDIITGTSSVFAREIHAGFTRTNEGEWVSFCGTWNVGWSIDPDYLPSGCNDENVQALLAAARS
ncbi:MAG: prepilin-type N-terminal cleavage/methylation domain-containing protein [Pseudomonadota bacterium]